MYDNIFFLTSDIETENISISRKYLQNGRVIHCGEMDPGTLRSLKKTIGRTSFLNILNYRLSLFKTCFSVNFHITPETISNI